MSDQPTGIFPTGGFASLPWYRVWINAVTRPSVDTYTELLARDPNASMAKAFGWIALASFIGSLIGYGISLLFDLPFLGLSSTEDLFGYFVGATVGLICLFPFIILFTVIAFAINVGIIQLVARILGGEGTYDEMTYTIATFSAPVSIISVALSNIPYAGFCITLLIAIYAFVLNVIAVKAVNRFDWGPAILASLSPVIIGILFACCVVLALSAGLVAISPALEEAFPEFYRFFQTVPQF